jgi:acetyl-CoA carboxylase biotin carboxyl carrier protein
MNDTRYQESLAQLGREVRGLVKDVSGPLRRLRLSAGEAAVEIEWHLPEAQPAEESVTVARPLAGQQDPAERDAASATTTVDQQLISSPMVGTFYRADSEGGQPYVTVGDVVEEGQTVGIVEAMKLFNPIAAECSGVVLEVLAGNAKPVQFGEPLIRLGTVFAQPAGAERGV